jgi:hypothetical protein
MIFVIPALHCTLRRFRGILKGLPPQIVVLFRIVSGTSSIIGPYFVAEMSWVAVEGLVASEHADSIEYIECDVAVSATTARNVPVTQDGNGNGTRSATEQALLAEILATKYRCGGNTVSSFP